MLIKVIGIGVLTVVASLLVKELKPELSFLITLAGSLIILTTIFSTISGVVKSFNILVEKTNINLELFRLILKIIGIAYLTEFAYSICVDMGSKSVGDKIVLAGKITILIKCFPIINSLLDLIIGFIP